VNASRWRRETISHRGSRRVGQRVAWRDVAGGDRLILNDNRAAGFAPVGRVIGCDQPSALRPASCRQHRSLAARAAAGVVIRLYGAAGIIDKGGALSSGWREARVPGGVAEGGGPARGEFSDRLIAVLPRLRRFARGLTGAPAEADDLVQAACERALTRQHQFQEGTRFDSWMFRIVQTIWIDQLRARGVRKEDGEAAEAQLGTDAPVRRIEARLALAEIRQAIEHLPADQRTTLMLVTVDGLSYKEAAEVVGVPVGTIMSRLARARIALHQLLAVGSAVRRSARNARA
jgi:RNA polymerase sigma-70 factor, ECF subfamily